MQALDLMTASKDSHIDQRVAEFAWRVKNWVRPLGLRALNLPCQLMGTGMAFLWTVIRSANLASGEIVEDLKLGLDLALAGKAPMFSPAACVTSPFPSTAEGTKNQRERWERGQLRQLVYVAPRLFFKALMRGNVDLLALVLDLLVPPLTILALLLLINLLVAMVALSVNASLTPILLSCFNLVLFGAAVVLAWGKVGRDVLPGHELSAIGRYIFDKLGLYLRIFSRRGGLHWVRTDREQDQKTRSDKRS